MTTNYSTTYLLLGPGGQQLVQNFCHRADLGWMDNCKGKLGCCVRADESQD